MSPFFTNQEQAISHPRKNTNIRYKHFYHDIFHAGDINQFEEIYKREYQILPINGIEENVEKKENPIDTKYIENISPLYHNINGQDVFNTFSYLYHKFKKGIFVSIQRGKLETFLPFTNVNYTNEWSDRITLDPKIFQGQKFNGIINKWYANNYLLRHEYPIAENDTSVAQYKYLLEKVCNSYQVPDIEFFINKRDFPLLKENLTEPYEEIWDSDNVPLVSHKYSKYAPILSPCKRDGFADILLPTPDDISRIGNLAGVYFRRDSRKFCMEEKEKGGIPKKSPEKMWSKKINLAVFRGSSTGRGCTIEDNARLKLASLQAGNEGYLNVGITKWNCRVKKLSGNPMLQKIQPETLPFKLVEPLDYSQQAEYRYIIHIQGHTCAYRLSVELSLGSVILLVQGKYKLWYSNLLKEYIHYVPVKEDLSDLFTQIDWCRKHPKTCGKIVRNCGEFYSQYLSENGILKYMYETLLRIKKFTGVYNYPKSPLVYICEKQREIISIRENIRYREFIPNLSNKNRYDLYMISKPIFDIISNGLNDPKNGDTKNERNNVKIQYCEILGGKYKTKPNDINELFIGKNCINNIIESIPNFIYTLGVKNNQTIQEYIPGMTFFEYLQDTVPNIQTIIKILIAVLCAIQVAQNSCCFVHNDLYPWNIVLSPIEKDITISYNIAYKTVYNISYLKGEFLPVIIDYNKSGGIPEGSKGINYNIIDPSQNNISRDPYNLLISTFNTLLNNHKLEKWDYSIVYNICKIAWDQKGNLKQYLNDASKYEKIISCKIPDISPVKMIQHLLGFVKGENVKDRKGWFISTENYSFDSKIKLQEILGNDISNFTDPKNNFCKKISRNILYKNYFYREFYKYTGNPISESSDSDIYYSDTGNPAYYTEKWINGNLYNESMEIQGFPTKYSYLSETPGNPINKNQYRISEKNKSIPQLYTLLIDALNYRGPYELSKNEREFLGKIYNSIDWEKQYILYRYNSIMNTQ